MASAALERLDVETRSKLRSTQILTSLPQIISELVQNSLDAGASDVGIGINCDEWGCWVRDDGSGMNKDGLAHIALGREGGRYASSKAYSPSSLDYVNTFGFRGEALASAADLSCIEISSRTTRSKESWSLILKGGEKLYYGPSLRWRRERAGTTVTLRDAFFNLPIRRRSHPGAARTIELIRRELESLALVFPHVAFSLRDESKEKSQVLTIPKAVDESGEKMLSQQPGTRRSPRKSEQRPVYVLNLMIPPREIDNCLDPAKAAMHFQGSNQKGVAAFLADTIQSFLIRHGFSSSEGPLHTAGKRTPKRQMVDVGGVGIELDSHEEINSSLRVQGQSPAKRPKTRDIYIREDASQSDEAKDELTWVDPISSRTYLVDPRTGNSYIRDQRQKDPNNQSSRLRVGRRCARSRKEGNKEGKSVMPEWIKRALEANDSFAPIESAIPHLPSATLYNHTIDKVSQFPGVSWMKQPINNHSIPSQGMGGAQEAPGCSYTKASLARAQIVGQVDHKFIACIIDGGSQDRIPDNEVLDSEAQMDGRSIRTLVLVDQHAADERVRVERYLKTLCMGFLDSNGVGVERRVLDPDIPVLLTKHERDRLKNSSRMKKSFRNWGFDIVEGDVGSNGDAKVDCCEDGYGMVHFESVPEVVADKVSWSISARADLREFVKGYLARLEAESLDKSSEYLEQKLQGASLGVADADEFTWLMALRFCPHELIELVNSKACRGAIMFNDRLSEEQCNRLIRKLSMTAFPFQCAHGRPSVVPLTAIHRRETKSCRVTPVSTLPTRPSTSSTMGKSLTKVIYKPDSQSTEEFLMYVNPAEYMKWINRDATISLTEVVDSFDVFVSTQGKQGHLGKASDSQLVNTFGSKKDVDVAEILLRSGTAQSANGLNDDGATKNSSHGSRIDVRGSGARI
ncbi:hypothetical protein EW145_g4664 [Phellinidium pouzarii]|uniref:MutL C-terminal dimerisation domain-containing protein n=1 Tax=Phellinidium pouzarii TaxID=167371 RepID=A0A4S4L373_9AGAM|nr:hypothetical protein EW145_g4664 [Phellinidium pouzarii]